LTLDDERNALKPLLACCAEAYHVVGYSYGGVVALQMALADRQRVRTLTLIEPVFFNALRDAGETSAFSQFVRLSKDFEAALQQGGAETAIRPFMDFWTGSGSWDRLPLFVRAEMLKSARKIALDWHAAFAFAPDRQNLAALGPRTLLVRGTESPRPMLALVDALHALMPGSTRLIVEGANHLLPLTHADALTNAILSHLHADAERRLK
jgi:pimeloyl-ACP methyl ester carboxylesterase